MNVEVRRSAKRRKTVQARVVEGVLQIAIPAHMTAAEELHWVEVMKAKFDRSATAAGYDLIGRAKKLAGRYDLPQPTEILWSERQKTMWGSCTPSTGRIRIATRVSPFPDWVVDYVVVHELAHLAEAQHGEAFWALVNRYPDAAKARGYLEAKADGR